jgi:hypothetical protein
VSNSTDEPSERDQTDITKDGRLSLGIAVLAPIVALLAYLASPGSAVAVSLVCGLIVIIGIVANRVYGPRHGSIALATALVVAVSAGACGAVIAQHLKNPRISSQVRLPELRIRNPQGGDAISMTPVITGSISHLGPNQVVWSFNEPYTVGRTPSLTGSTYPDAGPCLISDGSFRCNIVFAGAPKDYCRQFRLWVAVLSNAQANEDANIKAGTVGNTYISIREAGTPPHVANAIDHVHVHRDSGPKPC